MRVLILGGTSEANQLAKLIAPMSIDAILSLAGRTLNPILPPIPVRFGGFGGVAGMTAYLAEHHITAVIDATHPFAARISANAVAACRQTDIPLLRLTRPQWRQGDQDNWILVPDMAAAVRALGDARRRVFLTVGGLQLAAFTVAPQHHYLIRTIEMPADLAALPDHRLILARGPFTVEAEIELMRDDAIDVLVTKNSGAQAIAAKLEAARSLALQVVMIDRPAATPVPAVDTPEAVLTWLAHRATP